MSIGDLLRWVFDLPCRSSLQKLVRSLSRSLSRQSSSSSSDASCAAPELKRTASVCAMLSDSSCEVVPLAMKDGDEPLLWHPRRQTFDYVVEWDCFQCRRRIPPGSTIFFLRDRRFCSIECRVIDYIS